MRKINKPIKIARERIDILFEEAEKAFRDGHPERANRYVEIARTIAMKVNLKMPVEYKRRFCKHCYSYLVPGKNCTVRLNSKKKIKIIKCEVCGKISRIPYYKKAKKADLGKNHKKI